MTSAQPSIAKDALLETKIYVPLPGKALIQRQSLLKRLDSITHRQRVIITAPTGAGKTSLICQWLAQTSLKATWFSIDKNDNESNRFWRYVVAALQRAGIALEDLEQAMFQATHPVENRILLTKLINDVGEAKADVVLVLDDYHFITNAAVHQELSFLLDNLPPNLHFIILSRTQLPFPIAHLRVRDQLIQVNADDLRFSFQEIAAFFQNVMKLDLTIEQLHLLEARTEGWAAGLQLAGLSLRGRSDITQFIHDFRGNHDYILDYLTEQVLNQQPPEVKAFLLQTAILDKLCAPLCAAVTGEQDVQSMLTYLNHQNLFVVSLDSAQNWYRYHHLFADLLRVRLHQSRHYDVLALHQRASRWYEEQGFPVEAVDHALAGQDLERASALVHQAMRKMFSYGEFASLLSWMEHLPREVVQSEPRFQISYAWGLVAVARLDEGERELDDAEDLLNRHFLEDKLSQHEHNKLLGQIEAIRAFVLRLRGQTDLSVQLSEQAMAQSPHQHHLVRGLVALNLGMAHRENHDLSAARLAFTDAVHINRTAGHIYIAITSLNNLGDIEFMRGYLREAQRLYEQSIEVADEWEAKLQRPLPICGVNFTRLGDLYYEWNELDTATDHYRKGLQLGQRGGIIEILSDSYLGLARVAAVNRDYSEALDLIDTAYKIMSMTTVPMNIVQVLAAKVRVLIRLGRYEGARFWLDECERITRGVSSRTSLDMYTMQLIRLLIAQEQQVIAARYADDLLERFRLVGLVSLEIETLVLSACAYYRLGSMQKAMNRLERALILARPGQFVRCFIDEGSPVIELLYLLASHDVEVDYAELLLSTCDYPKKTPDVNLSEREIDVLNLLEKGFSNRHIADKLFIAPSTVKVHTRRLYNKLNVNSREQAVARAKALQIL